ncbi:MAG: hypothetical protein A3G24_18675 [Betaproteobacteria bacterium RIFCSPLOWO2_12_FULL_62_13]|nr:MAG: hypothetical protein A3G24_18675 [Betaproteobacteria bacterium RIFCSPLOWO2_12_FULL_62_13]
MPLPHPAHHRGKQNEYRKRDADNGKRVYRVMYDDLIDNHLGEHGRGQSHQLDRERGKQHVAPDCLVPEEFGDEPAESELILSGQLRIFAFQLGCGRDAQQNLPGELFAKLGKRRGDGGPYAFLEV